MIRCGTCKGFGFVGLKTNVCDVCDGDGCVPMHISAQIADAYSAGHAAGFAEGLVLGAEGERTGRERATDLVCEVRYRNPFPARSVT